jgi:hypothetical protein
VGEAINSKKDYTLPTEVGVAVTAHIFYEIQSGSKMPNPDLPEDVQYVAKTVLNHTGIDLEELAEFIPAVKVYMSLFW